MPSYPEGTRQWAEQQRDQAYRLAVELLEKHGYDPYSDSTPLTTLPWAGWRASSSLDDYEAREDLRIYNQLVNDFYVMCDYVEDPPVKDAGDPIYSRAELEAAGQGTLI